MPIDLETCSPPTTRTLFADVSDTQRETLRIAQDPSTAAEVLLALVSDELLVARAVARNISITPAVATALLARHDMRTNRALAGNPATPAAVLAAVAHKHPAEVLANPAFDLAVLCDPGFILELPFGAAESILGVPTLPAETLLWYAQRLDVFASKGITGIAALISVHPNAPRAALDLLQSEPLSRLHVASQAAYKRPWMDAVIRILRSQSPLRMTMGDTRILGALATNGLIDGHDLLLSELIIATSEVHRRRYIGSQRDMSEALLLKVLEPEVVISARHMNAAITGRSAEKRSVMLRVARRDHCGDLGAKEDALALASSRALRDRVRSCLALGLRLSESALQKLLVDRSWKVRAAVAHRPQLSEVDAIKCAADVDVRVRRVIATVTSHPSVLGLLSGDIDGEVRLAVAANPACPGSVDEYLRSLSNISQFLAAAWRRGEASDGDGKSLSRLTRIGRWGTEEAAMLALRSSYNSLPRFLLLSSARCPVEILEDHADYSSWWIRLAVARNGRTPEAVLMKLRDEDYNWVIRSAANEALLARQVGIVDGLDSSEPLVLGDQPDSLLRRMPLVTSAISESYMPAASRRRMAEVRRMLGAEEWERVEAGLALAMGDPHTRRIIMCGMIPTARGMTASVLSEVARRIDRKWREKAQDWLKERGVTQQMESVQRARTA